MVTIKSEEHEGLNAQPWVYQGSDGGTRINRQALYKYLKENTSFRVSDRGNIYYYDGKLYHLITDREFKATIKDYLPVEFRRSRDWVSVFEEYKSDHPDLIESSLDADEDLIGFTNGVLKLSTMELVPYSEDIMLSRMVPSKYLPKQTLSDAPIFDAFLNQLVCEDPMEKQFILEYLGAIISNVCGYRFKKMLILVGAGNTGKSVLRSLAIQLVGEDNCSTIELKRLQERFGTFQLYQKRLAGSGDMSNLEISDLNVAKELTGGDPIMVEQKGKDGFTFLYRGFLWFNANQLPFFRGDRGMHVYERFMIVRCENVVPEDKRDSQLVEKLMGERDAIASIAVDALKLAVQQGYTFTESECMMLEREQYAINNNSLFLFISDCCCLHAMDKLEIKRSEFNKVYKEYCRVNNLKPEREREIGHQLKEQYNIMAYKSNGIYYYPLEIYEDSYNVISPEHYYVSGDQKRRKRPTVTIIGQ